MCIKCLEILLKCEFEKVIPDCNMINFKELNREIIKDRSQKVLSNEHFFFFPKNCFILLKLKIIFNCLKSNVY